MNINEIRLGVLGSVSDLATASQELADKSNEIIRNLIDLAASQVTSEELEERIEQIPTPVVGNDLTLAQVEQLLNSALTGFVVSSDTRLSNPRTPVAHAASHMTGDDLLDLDSIPGELNAEKLYGSFNVDTLETPLAFIDDARVGVIQIAENITITSTGIDLTSAGASPLVMPPSAPLIANMNADKLDGFNGSEFGRLAISNAWDLGQIFSAAAAFQSPTVPFFVVGIDRVDNLNADRLDDQHGSYYLSAANLTDNLPYAQLPNVGGSWDVGSGNQLTLTRRIRLSDLVGVGVDPTSSTGFNCRPSTMTGTTQIGATYSPSWSVDATAVAVGLNVGGVGATKATPYTTTLMPLLRVQAPTRGGNQTITTLAGLYVEDLTATTAGNRYPIEAVNSIRADYSSTADDTRLLVWDVTAGTLKRVSRGAVDSGGAGFRLLRIPN